MIPVLTAAFYDSEEPWKHVRNSAARFGVPLFPYGQGMPFRGLMETKVRQLRIALTHRDESHVMYVDSQDSIFIRWDEKHLMRSLKAYGTPMIIAAETNCYPDASIADQFPTDTRRRFINAGGFFGDRLFILERLKDIERMHQEGIMMDDDQGLWAKLWLERRDFSRDSHSTIFQCMNDPQPDTSQACVLHFNGKVSGIEGWTCHTA